MMEDHFGLERAPFRLGTDTSFYYEAEAHRRAMAHLRYGLRQAEGFVVITGEPGVGKTMVIEQLLLAVQGSDVLIGMLRPAALTPESLPARILGAFDRQAPQGADPIESLKGFLSDERRRGAKASLVIDEAQHLSDALLEELRIVSELSEDGEALLQVCLIGQTPLRRVLFRDDMEQFRQRVVASYHLGPLNAEDTEAYIAHRMSAAGYEGPRVFTEAAVGAIHRITGGVPRRINTLCARLLVQAEIDGRHVVDADDAQGIAAEAAEETRPVPSAEDGTGDDEAETPSPTGGAAEEQRPTGPPNLTLVETPSDEIEDGPGDADRPTDQQLADEEAEAERTLALVTAPPRDQAGSPAEDDAESAPASRRFSARARGGGSRQGYAVTVGEINAAILSIQSGQDASAAEKTDGPDAPRGAAGPLVIGGPIGEAPAAPRRMASPQELMLRGKPQATEGPSSERAAVPRGERAGRQEETVRAFLAETDMLLRELRASLAELGSRVDALDTRRRENRKRLEEAISEAKDRLDEAALER